MADQKKPSEKEYQPFPEQPVISVPEVSPREHTETKEKMSRVEHEPQDREEGAKTSAVASDDSQDEKKVFSPKSSVRQQIEHVLEENLDGLYFSLSKKQRDQFRIEGERVASRIEVLLKKTHVKILDIIGLIRSWITLIPGVNRFFLEQEAKIKAEKILSLNTPPSHAS